MMSTRLYDAFEVCLAALATGVDLETCLSLYPDLSEDLRPALEGAQHARSAARGDTPADAMKRSRARFLSRAAALRSRQRPVVYTRTIPRLALFALAFLLVIFGSLNGLVVASAKTLPGDALYPVKRAAENVSLSLARDRGIRQQMEESYQHRRAEEVRSLLAQQRVHSISMEGVVSSTASDQWVVNGIPVRLKAGTSVIGEIKPGRVIEVEGQTQPGGWIEADELHLRFYEHAGVLTSIEPGFWTVGESRFKISPATHIDPALEVSDRVLVLVYSSDDGNDYAQAILRLPDALPGASGFEPFEIEFSGAITAVAGDTLTVDGKAILLSDETELKGAITTGTLVKIHAAVAADGSLTALEIENITQSDSSGGGGVDDHPDESSPMDENDGSDDASTDSSEGSDDHPGEEDQSDNQDGESGSDDQSAEEEDDNSGGGGGEDEEEGDNSGSGGDEDDSSGDDENSGSDEDEDSGSDEDHSGGSDQDD